MSSADPPAYTPAQELFISEPYRVGNSISTIVSSTSETADFASQYFVIEQDISKEERIRFKVLPSGSTIDPDLPNDFLYGFNFKGALPSLAKFGKLGDFLISRGRGKATPNQVGHRSAFIDFGTTEDGNTYAKFYNPFAGPTAENVQFMWTSDSPPSVDREPMVFTLSKSPSPKLLMMRVHDKIAIAELRISQVNCTIRAISADPAWMSIEECAFIVGTAFAAWLGSRVQRVKMNAADVLITGLIPALGSIYMT
ncbi:hypothetical protein HDU83_005869 [Entophlyctis luteolus]|nr:hypothetical protein HDU83_005869 [Entophlyctis luteolus]